MKKAIKIVILAVLAAAICLVMIWGINKSDNWPWGSINFNIENNGEGQRATEFQADAQGIQNINLDFISEDVIVVLTNEKIIRIVQTSTGKLDEDEMMICNQSSDTVNARSGFTGFHFFNFNRIGSQITVYVPATFEGSIDATTISGKMDVQDINISKLTLNTTSGRVELQDASATELKLNTVSGEITVEGGSYDSLEADSTSGEIFAEVLGVNEVECDTTSGAVRITSSAMPEKINADSVSGSVTVKIPENDGFSVRFDTVSGSMNNDFEMQNDVYKNGTANIEIDTVSGSVNIIKIG